MAGNKQEKPRFESRICMRCGNIFIPEMTRQRRCNECLERGKTMRKEKLEETLAKKRAAKAAAKKKPPKKPEIMLEEHKVTAFDIKVQRLVNAGLTYAEAQKKETAALYAKIDLSVYADLIAEKEKTQKHENTETREHRGAR